MDARRVVLVVDDERALREAIAVKLGKKGYEVIEARNGEQGLEMALEKQPDLILLDIVMPRMDRITMLRKLRQARPGRGLRVIILTNLSVPDEQMDGLDILDYLVKTNWKLSDLVDRVQEVLAD